MQIFYSLTAIAHYSVGVRDWIRDLSRPLLTMLKGKIREVIRQLFHTRELVSIALRLYGWWQMKHFARWQSQFARWLKERWEDVVDTKPPVWADEP